VFFRPILNTAVQIIGKVVTVGISLVTTGILTRKLGVSAYGSFTLITATFVLLDSFADFGTRIIGVKQIAEKESEEERKRIFAQIGWLRLGTTGIAFLIGLALFSYWPGFAGVKTEAIIALLMIWLTSLTGNLGIYWQSKQRMEYRVIIDILFPLLFLISLWWWKDEVTLRWVFWIYLGARAVSFLAGLWMLTKSSKLKTNDWLVKIDFKIVKKIFLETWPMGLYLLVFASYDRAVDSIMIERWVGIREVAWYGLGYKIYSNLLQPVYFFVTSLFPLLSSSNGQKKKLFIGSLFMITIGVLVLIPVIYFMAPMMVRILAGNDFGMTVVVLRVLLIAMAFSYIEHLVGFTLIAKGGQKTMLRLGLVALLVNILGNIFAIPRYGIVGAAAVTGLTEAVACSLMGWKLWKLSKI
jgi:O-antigen/teichoic acid export membrane protein